MNDSSIVYVLKRSFVENKLKFYDLVLCSAGAKFSTANELLLCGDPYSRTKNSEQDYVDWEKFVVVQDPKSYMISTFMRNVRMTDSDLQTFKEAREHIQVHHFGTDYLRLFHISTSQRG